MSSIILNSTHIIDSINNSTFQIDFERSVSLFDKHIALTSASLYFSWRNITSSNNKFSYIWIDDVEYSVELPIGFYEISDIRTYFQYVMTQNGHKTTNTDTDSTIFLLICWLTIQNIASILLLTQSQLLCLKVSLHPLLFQV